MMKRFSVVMAAALAAASLVSSHAYGAAALAAGAKTSAKPTACDPAKRQIQIAADPIGITDFQFTLHYDPLLLHVANDDLGLPLIRAINGYTLGVRGAPTAPAYAIDTVHGFVTVRGYWPVANGEVPYNEIDVYDVVFQLNDELFPGVPIPDTTPFIIYSMGLPEGSNPFQTPDTMIGGNIVNGERVIDTTYTAGNPDHPILTADTGAINLYTIVSGVPEPTTASMVAPVAVLMLRRKRR